MRAIVLLVASLGFVGLAYGLVLIWFVLALFQNRACVANDPDWFRNRYHD